MRGSAIIGISLTLAATACGKDSPTYAGPPIASVQIGAASASIIVGQVLQLTVTVRDVNGAIVTAPPLTWQSSAAEIATVAQNGAVTGRAEGTVRIRANAGSVRDSVDITVTTNTFDIFTPGEVFTPFELIVPRNGIVRFHMFGDEHNAEFASVPGAPADVPIVKDQIVSRIFTVQGTFPYDCTVHPGMSGQIIVQ